MTLLRCRVTGDAPTLRAFLAETGVDVPCRPVAVRGRRPPGSRSRS